MILDKNNNNQGVFLLVAAKKEVLLCLQLHKTSTALANVRFFAVGQDAEGCSEKSRHLMTEERRHGVKYTARRAYYHTEWGAGNTICTTLNMRQNGHTNTIYYKGENSFY